MERRQRTHACKPSGRAALLLLAGLAGVLLLAVALWMQHHSAADEAAEPPTPSGSPAARAGSPAHAARADAQTPQAAPDAARADALALPGDIGAALAGPLALRIVNLAGEPVRMALVALWPAGEVMAGDDWPPHQPLRVVRTDAGGRCTLDVDAADQQLVADSDEHGTSGLWSVAEARAAANDRGVVALSLQPWAVANGSVQRADGRPARDTLVLCASAGTPAGPGRARLPVPTRTDARGEFRLQLDPGGLFGVMAGAGGAFTPEQQVSARANESVRVELAFAAEFAVLGTLLDPEGRPAPAGRVRYWSDAQLAHHEQGLAPEDRPSTEDNTVAVMDGRFRIALAEPGRYTLVGADRTHAPSTAVHVEVSELQPSPAVTLMLGEPAVISGVVLSMDGGPLRGAIVTAIPAAWRYEHTESGAPDAEALYGTCLARSHESGAFDLPGLHPAASYRLRVEWWPGIDGKPPAAQASGDTRLTALLPDVPAGTLDLRVVASAASHGGGVVAGRVIGGAPDATVAGRTVLVFHANDFSGDIELLPGATSDDDGRFTLEGLIVGERYALGLADVGHGWSAGTGESDWFTLTPTTGERLVQVVRSASFDIAVHDETGVPIPGAKVSVRRIGALEPAGREAPMRSDERGRAFFGELAPGRYELRATRGAWQRVLTADLADGEAASVKLALQRQD